MNSAKVKRLFLLLAFSSLCSISPHSFSIGNLSVEKEVSLNASAEKVWKIVGNFKEFHKWCPIVANSKLTNGSGFKPGDIRILSLDNGIELTEKLVIYSVAKKTYTYAIIESGSPIPVSNYVSTISVTESASGTSKVEWRSTFDANNVPEDEAVEIVSTVYNDGLNNLVKHFNK